MYNLVFGSTDVGVGTMDPGAGAAVGVTVALAVMVAYTLLMLVFSERKVEY